MELLFPQLRANVARNSVVWNGPLRHQEGGQDYAVELSYILCKMPHVFVRHPTLVSPTGKPIPHMYRDGSLCLHLEDEWNPSLFIADRIVPWISHWLFHYEIWCVTEEWEGGGVH